MPNSVLYHFRRKLAAFFQANKITWLWANHFIFVFLVLVGPSSGLTGPHVKPTWLSQNRFPFNLRQHTENENWCLRSRTHLHCQIFCSCNEKGWGRWARQHTTPEFSPVTWAQMMWKWTRLWKIQLHNQKNYKHTATEHEIYAEITEEFP